MQPKLQAFPIGIEQHLALTVHLANESLCGSDDLGVIGELRVQGFALIDHLLWRRLMERNCANR